MSAVSAWSYTSKATHWALLTRGDWGGVETFGAPVSFDCDYSADSVRMTDDRGVEFTSQQIIFTEKSDAKQGDRVLIGVSAAADPIAAGAFEVRKVTRYADTFDNERDDFVIAT